MSASNRPLPDLGALSDEDLRVRARRLRNQGHGRVVSYSPKIFIPLTRLCRDRCGYCVYRRPEGRRTSKHQGTNFQGKPPFMTMDEVLELARRGAEMGCREALFVLGERPEEAYAEAAQWLRQRGYASSIDYLEAACRAVLGETGLLPHSNAGTMSEAEMKRLASVNVSLGLMLESTSRRLMLPGGPHAQAPSKDPALRLAQLEQAGRLGIPFTTGVLIGIGESRQERIESLQAIRRLADRYGHIQETIVQNFRRKAGTPMAEAPEPSHREMLRTIAMARLILGPDANLQAPPNLARYGEPQEPGTAASPASPQDASKAYLDYLEAGINDYGGLSPLTFDWVNPEAPWPHLSELAADLKTRGYRLRPRLAVYPEYLHPGWLPRPLLEAAQSCCDDEGYCREGSDNPPLAEPLGVPVAARQPDPRNDDPQPSGSPADRSNGTSRPVSEGAAGTSGKGQLPARPMPESAPLAGQPMDDPATLSQRLAQASGRVRRALEKALGGGDIEAEEAAHLLQAAGTDHRALLSAADHLRFKHCGDEVTYVVNRNINFTNVCVKGCRFCAFSRGFRNRQGYWLPTEEIIRRAREASDLGCTEVCVQAGLPPDMPGDFYIRLCEALKTALPDIHIHAFSPEEVLYGSQRSQRPVRGYLSDLKSAGVGSLPGTSAEILVQEVRDRLAPERISVEQWIEVITAAHELDISTTSTIMYGHIETPLQSARHLLLLRELQRRTGGFSEFVPLSFVAPEAPLVRRGLIPESRLGATRREVFNMHATARLVLGKDIRNIQASWVKEGFERAEDLLSAGANDLGGTLINESISTSAGASHGQLATPARLRRLIRRADRLPVQRNTLYRKLRSFHDPADDPQEPLDDLDGQAAARFGSYESLIEDARFPFAGP